MTSFSSWYSSSWLACCRRSWSCTFSVELPDWQTLSSDMDGAGVESSSHSANPSSCIGSSMGCQDRAILLLPLHQIAVKLHAISLVHRCCSLGLSILSRRWLLRMDTSRLWSVMIWKFCRPLRDSLHFMIVHATANSSNLITAYLDSASVRKRLPTCTINHC